MNPPWGGAPAGGPVPQFDEYAGKVGWSEKERAWAVRVAQWKRRLWGAEWVAVPPEKFFQRNTLLVRLRHMEIKVERVEFRDGRCWLYPVLPEKGFYFTDFHGRIIINFMRLRYGQYHWRRVYWHGEILKDE